jgi:hypothetical protein
LNLCSGSLVMTIFFVGFTRNTRWHATIQTQSFVINSFGPTFAYDYHNIALKVSTYFFKAFLYSPIVKLCKECSIGHCGCWHTWIFLGLWTHYKCTDRYDNWKSYLTYEMVFEDLKIFVFKKYLVAILVHFYDLVIDYLLFGGWCGKSWRMDI